MIPHTTSVRGSRFEVEIAKQFLDEGAFDVQNPVTLPHVRLIRRLGALSPDELARIEDAVKFWLGLS
jgi:mRNA interferase MazF